MRSSHSEHGVLGEYHKVAETLFPPEGFSPQRKPDLKAVRNFAKALGIDAEYERLYALDRNDAKMREFLGHFRNNLDLLIQKTWVEKFDEERKGKLQDEIPLFMDMVGQGDFQKALEGFGNILEELAYLFFGLQSTKDDFTEYTFRIDLQMGLFWWYGCRLGVLKKDGVCDDKFLWAVLLLGLCYLTNF